MLEVQQRFLITQTVKFSIEDFFSKCDQIRRNLWIYSHWLKKSLMENFILVQCLLLQVSSNFASESIEIKWKFYHFRLRLTVRILFRVMRQLQVEMPLPEISGSKWGTYDHLYECSEFSFIFLGNWIVLY